MKKNKNSTVTEKPDGTIDWKVGVSHLVILLTTFFFYANILKNDVALDDIMVLSKNTFVQQGVEGIPDIITHDSFYGATHKPATQLGWRYRPLSLVLFAIVYEFFGADWSVFHFLSILLYAIAGMLAFSFVRRHIFSSDGWLPLAAIMLFMIHPVHTEVVANIKSCDELLAFLFTVLTLDKVMTWQKSGLRKQLLWACLFFTLALFSKESSAVLVGLIPILLYVGGENKFSALVTRSLPFVLLTTVFVLVRLTVSSVPEIERNIPTSPYLLATGTQKVATVFLVLGEYVRLLFYPSPLIFDYGFNHIPYTDFSDLRVWFSMLLYIAIIAGAAVLIIRRRIEGFFLLTYFIGILLLSNLFIDVGPILAERFLFTPGFFLLMVLLALLNNWLRKSTPFVRQYALVLLTGLLIPVSYQLVTARNEEWKDNKTLYAADLKKAPRSFRVLAFNGMTMVNDAEQLSDSVERLKMYRAAIKYIQEAYRIYPSYKMMYKEWGYAYYQLGDIDSAEWVWNRFRELNPGSQYNAINDRLIATARFDQAIKDYNLHYREANYPYLKKVLKTALYFSPENSSTWSLLGKVYFLNGQQDSARFAWQTAIRLDSTNAEAVQLLRGN